MKTPAHGRTGRRHPVPPVLRSWQEVQSRLGVAPPAGLPIASSGATYIMAQELAWLDASHFAVGRWDGSMSIFQFNQSPQLGPVIAKAINTPSAEGVQMITLLVPGLFVTSNDAQSMIVWQSPSGRWSDLVMAQRLAYSSSLGVANSGASYVTPNGAALFLIVGHAGGFVTIWQSGSDGSAITLIETVDVRSATPVNPWGLHNVRGVGLVSATDSAGFVITGSEDGDLCLVRVPDGTVVSRIVYNPTAQRGINSLAVSEGNLLVANCAVGNDDSNLWSYSVDALSGSIVSTGSAKLVVDPTRAQVFNFDVIWGQYAGGPCWFSATEEGYLWMGTATAGGGIAIIGSQKVTSPLGAAIGLGPPSNLALVAYDLYEFDTGAGA
ncbi:MAG: hypothetical protein JNK23_08530 [Opitutaceae bacterium]|nr:hypothetical protein [Opitutaceae bacterium]